MTHELTVDLIENPSLQEVVWPDELKKYLREVTVVALYRCTCGGTYFEAYDLTPVSGMLTVEQMWSALESPALRQSEMFDRHVAENV